MKHFLLSHRQIDAVHWVEKQQTNVIGLNLGKIYLSDFAVCDSLAMDYLKYDSWTALECSYSFFSFKNELARMLFNFCHENTAHYGVTDQRCDAIAII